MKGKLSHKGVRKTASGAGDAEAVAVRVFERLVAAEERLGRFLALTGLRPESIREAAAAPGFLTAVLDHVCSDERLLVEVADELALRPDRIAAARSALAPTWSEDP